MSFNGLVTHLERYLSWHSYREYVEKFNINPNDCGQSINACHAEAKYQLALAGTEKCVFHCSKHISQLLIFTL